jgi:D-serine deaminase-like pyridoxal phosphate-dependent protein
MGLTTMAKPDLNSIETPAVLVAFGKLMANIAWAQRTAVANQVVLRPHIKTHKSLEIARLQLQAGAVGITASKADEALVFIEGGVKSVTVAYPQVDSRKLIRLMAAARRKATELRLTIDSSEGIEVAGGVAEQLGFQVGIFIEIDVGLHRCGISEADPRLLAWVEGINRHQHLRFIGLLAHAGHAYAAKDAAEVRAIAQEECAILNRVRSRVESAGFEVKEVSVGATPTFLASGSYDGITEVRPGNYVFMDATPVRLGLVNPERIALSVLATIVSANEQYFIIDAGSKVLSSDLGAHGTGGTAGYGTAYTLENYEGHANGLAIAKLSEEHGFVKRDGSNLSVGTRLRIIPNHACPVANLAEGLVVVKEDGLAVWPVDARSKVH